MNYILIKEVKMNQYLIIVLCVPIIYYLIKYMKQHRDFILKKNLKINKM